MVRTVAAPFAASTLIRSAYSSCRLHHRCNPQVDVSNLIAYPQSLSSPQLHHRRLVVSLQEPVQPGINNGPEVPCHWTHVQTLISNKRVQRCISWAW